MNRRRIADAVSHRFDALVAFDPGENQLLVALGVLVGVACSLGVLYLFMQVTHALWIQAPAGVTLTPAMAVQLAAQHHGETLLAMLLGGIIGMLSAFAVVDTKPRDLTITMALMPVPMLATMALSVQFLHDRTLGILVMAVVMGLAVYAPKFTPRIGPRAFLFGNMLFIGYLFGFLSNGAVGTGDLGWVAAILWVAALVNFILKLAIFIPLTRGALVRTIHSFFARSRGVIGAAALVLEAGSERELVRARRRLRRRLMRLNEVALIVDARLSQQPEVAQETHDRLFDTELSVQNIGRLADALADATLPDGVRAALADSVARARESRHQVPLPGLVTLRAFGEDPERIRTDPLVAGRVMRLADSLVGWQLSTRRWREQPTVGAVDAIAFESPVALMFGNLPGSALVSRAAAAPAGTLRARFGLDFPAQAAIRIGTAVVIAAAIGSVLSERRFYWAVLAVFVSNMGTNTSAEQLTKAGQRVGGTVIGILVGSLLANAVGHSTWSIVVVLVALFFGIYFMRANYALMVLGITITVSQLYVQLGEYTNHLLVLRLEETAIGAAVAALAALVVFPIHARQATRVAARDTYARLGDLLDALIRRLDGEAIDVTLPSRSLDSAAHALQSAARPIAQMPFRSDELQHNLLLFSQASHHLRNVAAEVGGPSVLDDRVRQVAMSALRTQLSLVRELEARVTRALDRTVSCSEDLRRDGDLLAVSLDHGGNWNERQLLRHIARLGETLAELSDNLQRRLPEPTSQPEVDPGLVAAA